MQCCYNEGEIIVVDNNSSDKTNEVAQSAGGVRVVFEEYNQISKARNTGARAANGPFLLFIDADTRVSGDLISASLSALNSGKYCGGGANVTFDCMPTFIIRLLCQLWQFMARRLGLAAGCFVFCLKEAFDDIGGFSEQVYAGEEIYFSRDLSKWGRNHEKEFLLLDIAAVTSSRKFSSYRTIKILSLILLLGLFPWLVRFRRVCNFWYTKK